MFFVCLLTYIYLIGAAIGAFTAGPPGAIAGFAIGYVAGQVVGKHITLSPPNNPVDYGALEKSSTFVYLSSFPVGPFSVDGNSLLWDIVDNSVDQRYGSLQNAGSLARPGPGNAAQAFYPTSGTITAPVLNGGPVNNTYKAIFVIVQVCNIYVYIYIYMWAGQNRSLHCLSVLFC